MLNGDIFDFDSIMAIPENPPFSVSWLERKRGLKSEESKSLFKMDVILGDHAIFFDSLQDFVAKGNHVVFVIGNHDVELHWPSVQEKVIARIAGTSDSPNVRVAEWFYMSASDTLIEHGNQYDAYCLCSNPINPLIKRRGKPYVRLPFGNLAGKYMVNGMGLINPHSDASFIRESIWDYMVFYYKYVIRTQPLLPITWFWGAMVTLGLTIGEGLRPALTDPLTIGDRVEKIAQKANSTPRVALSLRELHAHPAAFNPIQTLQELWLDRALLFALVVFVSFQIYSVINVFVTVSILFFVIPLFLLFPIFIFYARSVKSELAKSQAVAFELAPISAKIAGVKRVIHGHTHYEKHTNMNGVEYLNTGTWSPSFKDPECTIRDGRKCFAWLKPGPDGTRVAELHEWQDEKATLIPVRD